MSLLRPEDFEPWIGRNVRVKTVPEAVEVKLERVERNGRLPKDLDFREPFSLFFEAAPDIYLLDATYEMDCGRGGPHAIFITQLQPSPDRRHYQAVFS